MRETEVACPACGKANRYTASQCAHCGERIAIASAGDGAGETARITFGCLAWAIALCFFAWFIFFREPTAADLRHRDEFQREIERDREIEAIRLENARLACDSGLASACIEYADRID